MMPVGDVEGGDGDGDEWSWSWMLKRVDVGVEMRRRMCWG